MEELERSPLVNTSMMVGSNKYCCAYITRGFLTFGQFLFLLTQTSYFSLPIGVVGVSGNIVILITYHRIGLSSSINVSYFALAISDLFCVLSNTWMAICFVPAFTKFANRYFGVYSVVSVTGAWTCECFSRITAYITAFISIERCVSVVLPMKVSTIFNRRRTCIILAVIYSWNLALGSYGFVLIRFTKFWSPRYNKTIITTQRMSSPTLEYFYEIVLFFQSFPAVLIPLVTVIVCTVFLSVTLTRSATWRRAFQAQDGGTGSSGGKLEDKSKISKSRNLKELQLAKTVVTIAIVFIVCSLPNAINVLVASSMPEYRGTGTYGNTYRFVQFATFILSAVNSSANIFIYLNTGSIFRRTVKQLFRLGD